MKMMIFWVFRKIMMSCKVDWEKIDDSLKNKLLELAPEKHPEDFLFYPEKNAFAVKEKNNFIRSVGCETCLLGDKGQDEFGYITLGGITLLNYKDLINDNILPVNDVSTLEISSNTWICPNCFRWILDYIPKYDTLPVGRFECQPSN